jgi:hypothetical protein
MKLLYLVNKVEEPRAIVAQVEQPKQQSRVIVADIRQAERPKQSVRYFVASSHGQLVGHGSTHPASFLFSHALG